MYFQSFKEFIEMGGQGHASFIWSAYAAVSFGLITYFYYSKQLTKRYQQELIAFYKRLDVRTQQSSNMEAGKEN